MKRYPIRDMIEQVNARNAASVCSSDVRQGWNSLLETVLHAANVYAGYGYLDSSQVPEDQEPGIVRGKTNETNTYPDETRRFYYIHHKLRDKVRCSEGPPYDAATATGMYDAW